MSKLTSLGITNADIIGSIFGFLCIIGVYLPWLSYLNWPYDVYLPNGIDIGHGLYIIILSLFAIGLIFIGIRRTKRIWAIVTTIIIGLINTLISIFAIAEILSVISKDVLYLQCIGYGLYLTIIGAIGLIISGLWNFLLLRK